MFKTSHFQLRLTGARGHLEFDSTPGALKRDTVRVFTQFLAAGLGKQAQFEVYHPRHGWHLVCLEGVYLIMGSPLLVNYHALTEGIYQTLAECDSRPSGNQIRARRAQLRRAQFFVVKSLDAAR